MNPETVSTDSRYARCQRIRDAIAPLGPLMARLALGIVFFVHGSQKMLGWFGGNGFGGTVQFMHDKMGIPVALAALAAIAEFFGSIGVLLGLGTRLAAFGIFCVMAVAVFLVHLPHGFFSDKHGFEYPMVLGLVALSLIFSGGGRWSIDAIIRCRCRSRE
jgi:putative oxidoreductase